MGETKRGDNVFKQKLQTTTTIHVLILTTSISNRRTQKPVKFSINSTKQINSNILETEVECLKNNDSLALPGEHPNFVCP